MGDEDVRLPGSSYDELTKIIVGYRRFDGEVSPTDIGRVTGMHETIVSRNNAFLMAIGIVNGGKRKGISESGRGSARALEHQLADENCRHWQTAIADVPF